MRYTKLHPAWLICDEGYTSPKELAYSYNSARPDFRDKMDKIHERSTISAELGNIRRMHPTRKNRGSRILIKNIKILDSDLTGNIVDIIPYHNRVQYDVEEILEKRGRIVNAWRSVRGSEVGSSIFELSNGEYYVVNKTIPSLAGQPRAW